MKKIRFTARSVPLALLLACLLGFAPLIRRLGFYWDDWPSMWFLHILGPAGFREGFAIDRPLLAWVFMLTTPILGESALAWQAFSILARWLTSLAFFWTLIGIWPDRPRQAAAAALLFAIYPGFSQQYISVTYSNAFLVYALFFLSLGSMAWAFRCPRRRAPLLILSYLSAGLTLFMSEYFFGLELLRPLILWLLLKQPAPSTARSRKALLHWSPYALIIAIFIVWRLFLHVTPRGEITLFASLRQDPIHTIFAMALTILQNILETTFGVWFQKDKLIPSPDLELPVILLNLALVVGAAALSFLYLRFFQTDPQVPPPPWPGKRFTLEWSDLIPGVLALLLGGWPIWATNVHIELFFPWDRFTLLMMPGAALLLVGLGTWLARKYPARQAIALGLLVGFAAGINFQSALAFRQDWLLQKSFFWQLAWRAPHIQPGTILLTSELPFDYESDNSLTAPLIWMYAPQYRQGDMPYLVANIQSRLGDTLASLEPGVSIQQPYRLATFNGTTDQAIVLFHRPPRCLKVLDPQNDQHWPYKPLYIPEALPLSKPSLISSQVEPGAAPPTQILGAEPPHDWCYYFEKAELARQYGDWQQIAVLADQALKLKKNFNRETASELLPFLVGYAHTGQWEQAARLSLQAYQASNKTRDLLCQTWYNLEQELPASPGRQDAQEQVYQNLECHFP
ncbi:MAG: hypothetical protein AB1894_11750 [Chloroflexota bacterium]